MTGHRIHDNLIEERFGAISLLRIDREDALGALSRDLVVTLGNYFQALHRDDTIRVMVLTGTGKGFIAGADIGEYDRVSPGQFDEYQRLSRGVFSALEALPQFTIAAVNGYALGGGFEVALCCDLILASERAKFGLPEVKLGLLPGGGGTQRLARAAGIRLAKEAVVTGRFFTAAELLSRGIVTRVLAADELRSEALDLARSIADNAPLAVQAAKRLIDDGVQMSLDVGLTVEQQVLSRLYQTQDAADGIAAFLEKREPRFTGR